MFGLVSATCDFDYEFVGDNMYLGYFQQINPLGGSSYIQELHNSTHDYVELCKMSPDNLYQGIGVRTIEPINIAGKEFKVIVNLTGNPGAALIAQQNVTVCLLNNSQPTRLFDIDHAEMCIKFYCLAGSVVSDTYCGNVRVESGAGETSCALFASPGKLNVTIMRGYNSDTITMSAYTGSLSEHSCPNNDISRLNSNRFRIEVANIIPLTTAVDKCVQLNFLRMNSTVNLTGRVNVESSTHIPVSDCNVSHGLSILYSNPSYSPQNGTTDLTGYVPDDFTYSPKCQWITDFGYEWMGYISAECGPYGSAEKIGYVSSYTDGGANTLTLGGEGASECRGCFEAKYRNGTVISGAKITVSGPLCNCTNPYIMYSGTNGLVCTPGEFFTFGSAYTVDFEHSPDIPSQRAYSNLHVCAYSQPYIPLIVNNGSTTLIVNITATQDYSLSRTRLSLLLCPMDVIQTQDPSAHPELCYNLIGDLQYADYRGNYQKTGLFLDNDEIYIAVAEYGYPSDRLYVRQWKPVFPENDPVYVQFNFASGGYYQGCFNVQDIQSMGGVELPVAGANLSITYSGSTYNVRADSQGKYCVNVTDSGTSYNVFASNNHLYMDKAYLGFHFDVSIPTQYIYLYNVSGGITGNLKAGGKVYDASTNTIISSIQVRMDCLGGAMKTTNSTGEYMFYNITYNSNCRVSTQTNGQYNDYEIPFKALADRTDLIFNLTKSVQGTTGSLYFFVYHIVNGIDKPISYADISVRCPGYAEKSGQTNTAGTYQFKNLIDSCTYEWKISHDGYRMVPGSDRPSADTIKVPMVTDEVMRCLVTGTAKLLNESNNNAESNLPNVIVTIYYEDGSEADVSYRTAADGYYEFSNVECGKKYRIEGRWNNDLASTTITAVSSEGTPSKLTFTVRSGQQTEQKTGLEDYLLSLMPFFQLIIMMFVLMVLMKIIDEIGG